MTLIGKCGPIRMRAALAIVLLLAVIFGTQSCSLFGHGGGPRTVKLILTGSAELNACGGQLGNALSLRIYQLAGETAIIDARLAQLWERDNSLLEKELIARTDRFLDPGATDTLAVTFQPNTTHLAVVGNFCNAEGDCWRWIKSIDSLPAEIRLVFSEACIAE